jgi:hypothetical protein
MNLCSLARGFLAAAASAIVLLAAEGAAAQPCTPAWTAPAPLGLSDYATAMTVYNDGSGPALFVGGYFASANGVAANGVAKWTGSQWSGLGSGVSGGNVLCMTVFNDGSGDALYVGGNFTSAGGGGANHVAKWNGSSWSPVGAGFTDNVYTLCVFDDGTGPALYAGGGFVSPFGGHGFLAKWTGTTWAVIGNVNSEVSALAVFNDGDGAALYVGGYFTNTGTIAVSNIAKWTGSQWFALGAGLTDAVSSMCVFNDGSGPALAVGGVYHVYKWTQAGWSTMGSAFSTYVNTLAVFDDGTGPALHAGGGLNAGPFGTSSGYVSKWDGASSWGASIAPANLPVGVLGVFNDGISALYAGGAFTNIGNLSAVHIARWACPIPVNGSCCTINTCTITTQASCAGTWTSGGTCAGAAPCGRHCGSADFNCDNDVGTDADIEAFFTCLAGTCPALPCDSNADFNGDGDVGTDSDIEAFFRVLAGGTC